jgi:uridylate kinase
MSAARSMPDIGAEGDRWSPGQAATAWRVNIAFINAEVTAGRLTKGADGRIPISGTGSVNAYLATPASAALLAAEPKL